jgi:hypothetical protein
VGRGRGIAGRIQDLEDLLTERSVKAAAAGELRQADIVEQLIQMLPPEVRGNPVALIKTVESILALTTEQMRSAGTTPDRDGDLRTVLLHLCRTFFMREDDGGPGHGGHGGLAADQAPRGHPGDDQVTDDLEALLREVAELPRGLDRIDLRPSEAERFGVCLHQLLTTPRVEHARALQPMLAEHLPAVGEEELQMLRHYLAGFEQRAGSRGAEDAGVERLLALLRDPRHTDVLRSVLVLPDSFVIARFPEFFGLFLDSLDRRDAAAMQRLPDIAGKLGRSRILQRTAPLLKDDVLRGQRADKLLASPHPAMLPFAEIVLEHGDRSQVTSVVHFLRRVELSTPAAAALCVDEADLTSSFLLSLCRAAQSEDRSAASQTIRTAVNLLKQFISGHGGDNSALVQRQVYAVHALRRVWSSEVVEFLKGLGRRFQIGSDVPKPVREAARDALRQRAPKEST